MPLRNYYKAQAAHEGQANDLLQAAFVQLLPNEASLPFTVRLAADSLAADGSAPTLAVTASSLALACGQVSLQGGGMVAGDATTEALI